MTYRDTLPYAAFVLCMSILATALAATAFIEGRGLAAALFFAVSIGGYCALADMTLGSKTP